MTKLYGDLNPSRRPEIREKLRLKKIEWWQNPKNRQKMSGENNPSKRPEVRKKLSLANTGKKRSPEVKAKYSQIKREFYKMFPEKHPMKRPEVRAKITGDKNPMRRPEQRARMVLINNKRWENLENRKKFSGKNNPATRPEVRRKISLGIKNFRREHPEFNPMNDPISKNKISVNLKNKWKNCVYKDAVVKKIMLSCKKSPNKFERRIDSLLQEKFPSQFEYVGDGKIIINGQCPDFIDCNKQKRVILANGNYWHLRRFKNPDLTKDLVENREKSPYEEFGFKVLFIWEDELDDGLKEYQIIKKIQEFK